MADVAFQSAGEVPVAYLSGEIDHHTAQTLRQRIDETTLRQLPRVLVLDFGGVSFMDSSGVGLILGRQRRMMQLEGKLVVQHPPAAVERMLQLARVAYQKGGQA